MRALAFGDLQSELWGIIWLPGDEPAGQLAVRAGAAAAELPVTLRPGADQEPWSLEGDGISLAFAPTAAGARGEDAEGRVATEGQVCQVSGRVSLDGSEVEVSCLGWRSSGQEGPGFGQPESFRLLAGWLEPSFGFSLVALRPGRARGQEADAIAALTIEDPAPPPVVDPRLSTTYTDAGLPRRAGLELWLQEDEEAGEEATAHPYPRRAAGEVAAPALAWRQAEFELHASLLRWHSHGREGPGIYVLGRRQ
jgi:hypothetical protein